MKNFSIICLKSKIQILRRFRSHQFSCVDNTTLGLRKFAACLMNQLRSQVSNNSDMPYISIFRHFPKKSFISTDSLMGKILINSKEVR